MKVLFVCLQGVGNTILCIPALRYLQKQGAEVDIVVSDNGAHNIMKALAIAGAIYIYNEQKTYSNNLLRLWLEIRRFKYDAIYAMYPNGRRENLLAFMVSGSTMGGIADRRGYWRLGRFLLSQNKKLTEGRHDIMANLQLVGADPEKEELRPVLTVPAQILSEVQQAYFSNKEKKVIVIHPFAGQSEKIWSANNYEYVCCGLIQKGVEVIFVGSPSQDKAITALIGRLKGKASKITHPNILYSAAAISECDMFIGNDSALMHIAAGFDKPIIAIWTFTDYRRVAPYGCNSLLVKKDVDCSPCYSFLSGYRRKCRQKYRCRESLGKIKIFDIVSQAINSIMKGYAFKDVCFSGDSIQRVQQLWSGTRAIILK